MVLALGCNKTPPELAPASASPVSSEDGLRSATAPIAKKRCVLETPVKAPPIPSAAPASACPADPDKPENLPTAEISFPEAAGTPSVLAELVQGERQVEKGLMYRRSMPEERGMLFRFTGNRRVHSFWMHNTCIPLDMLFVDDDGFIVGIVEAAEPLTDKTRDVGCPSSWVLEVNAGWTRRHGVRAGQKMRLPP